MTTTIFRVENPISRVGLWYNDDGSLTEFIKTLPEAKSRDLPMGYDPTFKDGGDWVSGCDNIPDMRFWFSAEDLVNLGAAGYNLYGFTVDEYRVNPTYQHAMFQRESVIEVEQLDIKILGS